VVIAAWYGGLGPGLLATVLGGVAADWYYIVPQHSFGVSSVSGLAALASYAFACGFILLAMQMMHRAQRRLLAEVDQRKIAEDSLVEEKGLLATTLRSIGDAVIATNDDGRITFLNPEAERLTGWSAGEAQGRLLAEVFHIINEFSREAVENPVEKVVRTGSVVGLANHTVLIAKNGSELPIDDSAAPIRHPDGSLAGVVLVFRDFSERQVALRTSARLAAIVESSGDAILAKDLNGIIQSWNAAAHRLFGYGSEEVIGKPVTLLFPPERLGEEDQILARLREGQPVERLETIRVSKDGRKIAVSATISPIKDPEGRIIGASKSLRDITELVAAREALIAEKELLATTLVSIGDAVILTDAEGRVTFLNREAERLTRWNNNEATGRMLKGVFRIVDEETRAPSEDPVGKVIRVGTIVGLANHTLLIARDGTETPIDDSAAPIRRDGGPLRGVVLVFRDFAEQRRAQRQQQDLFQLVQAVSQARALPEIYQSALDTLARCCGSRRGAILFLDADGVMRFKASQGLSEGYRQQVEGHSPWKPGEPDPQPVLIQDTKELDPTLRPIVEQEGIRSLAFIPISYKGNLLGKLVLYFEQPHDFLPEEIRLALTLASQVALAVQRRRAEEQLEDQVKERTAKLREMMNELQHVSYAITHDMRAPLRAMSTFAGIILSDLKEGRGDSPELLDSARRIIASAARLDQLIQDALNYTKAVLQEVPLHPVNLARLIPSLIETYPNLQSDKADIRIQDPLPVVLGEESLLTQCFSNLLGNAVKFVRPGTHPRVEIRAHSSGDTARISVRDYGIGIAPESRARLFGMFERLTTGYEGTGIGLAIVRKVVDRMGGKVGVESEAGQGSEFWVELRTVMKDGEA
jgi:PAS domain S-box-containing protein